jgi:hypothetical protein
MAKQKLNLFKLASTIHDKMGHLALVSRGVVTTYPTENLGLGFCSGPYSVEKPGSMPRFLADRQT